MIFHLQELKGKLEKSSSDVLSEKLQSLSISDRQLSRSAGLVGKLDRGAPIRTIKNTDIIVTFSKSRPVRPLQRGLSNRSCGTVSGPTVHLCVVRAQIPILRMQTGERHLRDIQSNCGVYPERRQGRNL